MARRNGPVSERCAERERTPRVATVATVHSPARWIKPELGHRSIADVTVADVRKLVDKLGVAGLAPSTVTGIISIASGLFRFAVKSGLAERNPVRDLDRDDRPGTARLTEPRYLSADEIAAGLARVGPTFYPVIVACVFAALRISEALGLRWRDVDFDAGTVTVAGQLGAHGELVPVKSAASAATVPLLPALARELREHRSRQASVDPASRPRRRARLRDEPRQAAEPPERAPGAPRGR
ncbi:MAG: hypothetical protein E6G22_01645 [Actinobacteria bacterium]|nr:MAG: hypothetical protein E6G22_01645 [Actinomycetota bacterium]